MVLREADFGAEDKEGLAEIRKLDEFAALENEEIVRFLRARRYNIAATTKMLRNHVAWLEKYRPREVQMESLEIAIRSGSWRMWGRDKKGHPILFVDVGKWNPQDYDIDYYIRMCAWFLLRAVEMQPEGISSTVVVFDMSGWQLRFGYYMSYVQKLLDAQQNHAPETLEAVYLTHVPWIFQQAWKIIRPWIDERTAAKISFVSDDQIAPLLSERIDQEVLPREYGGSADMPGVPNVPGYPNYE
eukprot:c1929_g1_i1.p1 GENE.c1929_g1_i1~~c1929_g1_i1.p1  ORF type:complete len:243 (+),score=43.75 c1929_g1_i1:27-755(+)